MTVDSQLKDVSARVKKLAGPDPADLFGQAIRQSIDEVLDGPRTGRWDFDQLEKTEKTYVGTKLEIVVRSALDLDRGPILDLEVAGVPVDIKWAMRSSWQIPREAVGEICLCIGGLKDMTQFQVGVVRCSGEHLNQGRNRDQKRTLSAAGRASMIALVEPTAIPSNFLADMDPDLRDEVMVQDTIQGRVGRLFCLAPYTAIPRGAVATVAQTTGDPMRRVRADAGADDPLAGMRILSAKYGNSVLKALGRPTMEANHFMGVPEEDIDAMSVAARNSLPATARERLGFD